MTKLLKSTALALAASSVALTAVPAEARHHQRYQQQAGSYYSPYAANYGSRYAYGEPVYQNTRVWQGQNGNYYCRKKDGTTGLIIGGAVGALLGREVDKHGDRTLGTVIGAAAGALLGKQVTGGTTCR